MPIRFHSAALCILLAFAASSPASAQGGPPRIMQATNVTPNLLFRAEDVLKFEQKAGVDAKALAITKVVRDEVSESMAGKDHGWGLAGFHTVKLATGGLLVNTVLDVATSARQVEGVRGDMFQGYVDGVKQQGGTLEELDGETPFPVASYYVLHRDGKAVGNLILAGRGSNTVIVMLMGRYPLKDAGSINRFLAPKIDTLLDFKPALPQSPPR